MNQSAADQQQLRIERAWRAIREFRTLQPVMTSFAQAITGNQRVKVTPTDTVPHTAGNVIALVPSIMLGDEYSHEPGKCGIRNSRKRLVCKACDARELIMSDLFHEIGHIAGQSDVEPNPIILNRARAFVDEWHPHDACVHGDLIKVRFEVSGNYRELLKTIHPFLPILNNSLDDARVDRLMYKARPGLRTVITSGVIRAFDEGRYNPQEDRQILWNEAPTNAQMIIGLFLVASSLGVEKHWLSPEVIEALSDPALLDICERAGVASNAHLIADLTLKAFTRLNELGYFKVDKCIPPPPPPPPMPSLDKEEDESGGKAQEENPRPDPDSEPDEQDSGEAENDRDSDSDTTGGDAADHEPDDASSTDGGDESDSDSGDDGRDDDDPVGAPTESDEDQQGTGDDENSSDSTGENDDDADGGEDQEGSVEDLASSDSDDEGDETDDTNQGSSPNGEPGRPADSDPDGDPDGDDSADTTEPGDNSNAGPGGSAASPSSGAGQGGSGDASDEPGDTESDSSSSGSDDQSASDDDEAGEDPGHADEGISESGPGAGTAEEVAALFREFGAHSEDDGDDFEIPSKVNPNFITGEDEVRAQNEGEVEREEVAKQLDRQAVKQALVQAVHFDASSSGVRGLEVIQFPTTSIKWPLLGVAKDSGAYTRVWQNMMPDEKLLGNLVLHGRIVFDANKRSKNERGLKSGKVDSKALGLRAGLGDDRLFRKRTLPQRRSYFVALGVDCSGSTFGPRIASIKRAVMAQAELLHRLGVPFCIYGMTGAHNIARPMSQDGRNYVWMLEVKAPDAPWNDDARNRVAELQAIAENYDGHNIEFLRKVLDRRTETDRIIIYYTDGQMPAANGEEEVVILEREFKICSRRKYHVLGAGVGTDSPTKYGLDTVRLDSDEDTMQVLKQLDRYLTK